MKIKEIIYTITLIVFGLLWFILFEIERTTKQYILTRIGKLSLGDFFYGLLCFVVIGAIVWLSNRWRKASNRCHKGMVILGWVGIVVTVMIASLHLVVNHAVTTWHEFDSPNHKHSLVVREYTFLLLSDIQLYERTSPIMIRKLNVDLSPDDGFAPITNGAYKLSWDGDVVTLSVDLNQGGQWEEVKLNMEDHGRTLEKLIYYSNGTSIEKDNQTYVTNEKVLEPASDKVSLEDGTQEYLSKKTYVEATGE